MRLVQMLRRHEETAKIDGRKVDRPTPKGIASAYQKGIVLAKKFPDGYYSGEHSETQRTRLSYEAWALGISAARGKAERHDTLLAYGNSPQSDLNNIVLSAEAREEIRNITDPHAQCERVFTQYTREVKTAGLRVANRVLYNLKYRASATPGSDITYFILSISHGPPMDAAYLILLGHDVSYENVVEYTGIMGTGEGFDTDVTAPIEQPLTPRWVFRVPVGISLQNKDQSRERREHTIGDLQDNYDRAEATYREAYA
jgi:hypothetical protein